MQVGRVKICRVAEVGVLACLAMQVGYVGVWTLGLNRVLIITIINDKHKYDKYETVFK